jgi:prepilin-type N-terminal cleavage/methylation domain-containing protein
LNTENLRSEDRSLRQGLLQNLSVNPAAGRRPPAGFTMTELLIVVVILGMLISFAVPNYDKSRRRAYEKAMVSQLKMLADANKLYLSRNDTFYQDNTTDIDEINTNLNLDLVLDKMTFSYASSTPRTFTAAMTYDNFTVRIDNARIGPCCQSGPCPSAAELGACS